MKKHALALVFFCSCGVSREDLAKAIGDSQSCQAGDTCVLAGASACTCEASINQKSAAYINELAAKVSCGGVHVECPTKGKPRCQAGRCIAD